MPARTNIGADNRTIAKFGLIKILCEEGNSSEGIDGDIEESLGGAIVDINENHS